MVYISSADALRRLMQSEDTGAYIVKISPKDNSLTNGINYSYVRLKDKDGTNYFLHAYGKEARELHEEATKTTKKATVAPSLTNPKRLTKF